MEAIWVKDQKAAAFVMEDGTFEGVYRITEKVCGDVEQVTGVRPKIIKWQGYQQLAAGGLQVTDWSDTRLTGTLNADHDGICYLSIPAEDGWHVTIDGKQTETISIGEAMLGVPVSSGTHTIALRYCPKGTVVGTICCGSAILLLTFCFVIEQKQKRACRSNSVGRRRKTCEP